MPFSTEWVVPGRVAICRIVGEMTIDDAWQAAEAIENHVAEGEKPVHIIMDTIEMTTFPKSVTDLHRISRWLYHAKTGWIIMLNPGRLATFLSSVVAGMARVRIKTAANLDDALVLLRKVDISLIYPERPG